MRLLSDKQALRSGVFLDKILADCWQETVDPGPYGFEDKPDWSKVLIGDRVYVLVQIRAKSFGAEFSFKQQCTGSGCRQLFEHALDLNDLPVKTLSDEDKTAFADGNRIIGTLPDGKSFAFRLNTGADEVRAVKAGNATNFLGVLKGRIYEIEGMNVQEKDRYFEDGELSLAYGALAEMDKHDCGVETKLAISCPDCREEMEIEIPFAQGFLTPPPRPAKKI